MPSLSHGFFLERKRDSINNNNNNNTDTMGFYADGVCVLVLVGGWTWLVFLATGLGFLVRFEGGLSPEGLAGTDSDRPAPPPPPPPLLLLPAPVDADLRCCSSVMSTDDASVSGVGDRDALDTGDAMLDTPRLSSSSPYLALNSAMPWR